MDGFTPGCNRQRNDVISIPMPCSLRLLPFLLAALVLPGRLGGAHTVRAAEPLSPFVEAVCPLMEHEA